MERALNPKAQVAKRGRVVTGIRVTHSGPLPAPQTLAGYEQILPGAAERIFKMAETAQKSTNCLNIWNLILGFFVYAIAACTSIGIICLAAYALYLNKPLAAGIIGALVMMVLAVLGYKTVTKK
ncbi:MAG: DUF2335 domain-containing protein [Alphaproteobacteria bacterium]|nr:DUF2335 domain-containing protein [Alphaproteobacteria bacterium]